MLQRYTCRRSKETTKETEENIFDSNIIALDVKILVLNCEYFSNS